MNDLEVVVLWFMDKNCDCLKSFGIWEVVKVFYVLIIVIINMVKKIGYFGYSELVFVYGNKYLLISFFENFLNEEKDEFIWLLFCYWEKWIMVLGLGFL